MFCLEICRVNFPRNKKKECLARGILGRKFMSNISLSKTFDKKRQNLIRLFSCTRGIRNDYFLNYYEKIDFIKKRLNFDTDIYPIKF
jgi:hypothetical protein